jgi:DNA-binding NarL/FixJ family response regulator
VIRELLAPMKILLVEDSRTLRDRLRHLIDTIPNAVLVAETDNEDDARAHLERYRPDIAVVDLRLKGGSGLSVIEHIKAVYSGTTVVVLTNRAQPEYRAECMKLGAHCFFDKSKDINAFTDLLADLSSGRTRLLSKSHC